MTRLAPALIAELESARTEREIQPFLKAHPILVRNALNEWAWNYAEALPEFQIGAGRVDFLVLSVDSANWNAIFVELKSPRARLFTERGVPSRELNEVLQQLDDREISVNRNETGFREELSRHLASVDAAAYCSNARVHQSGQSEILDPRTIIRYGYVAVIGRRSAITPDDQAKRASVRGGKARIATYDRLIDVATKIDKAERE